jgi:hypothetical protein
MLQLVPDHAGASANVRLVAHVIDVVCGSPLLMRALRAARTVDAPDWLIGAGAVRDLVWAHLHGFDEPTAYNDIDLVFVDADDLSRERDAGVLEGLRDIEPDLPWDVQNQAAVHFWYPASLVCV